MKHDWRPRILVFRVLAPAIAVLAWAGLTGCPAFAKDPVMVRVTSGEHAYYGRVVLNAPGLTCTVTREGDHVLISFSDEAFTGELPRAPRNVLAIRAVPGGVDLTVPPGTEIHTSRMGDKFIIDIDDTVPNRPVTPAPRSRWTSRRAQTEPAAKPGETTPAPLPAAAVPAIATALPGVQSPRRPETPPRDITPTPAASPAVTVRGELPARAAAIASVIQPVPPERQPDVPNAGSAPSVIASPSGRDETPLTKPAARSDQISGNAQRPASTVAAADTPRVPSTALIAQEKPPGATPLQAAPEPAVLPLAAHAAEPAPGPVDLASPAPSEPVQVWPVTRDAVPSGPVALVATKARPPAGLAGSAIQIPFAIPVGAAMFSRGPDTFVVFDERRPIDLAALRDDPVFASAVVAIHPAATVVRLTRPPGRSAMLSPAQAGWRISIVPASPRPIALTPVIGGDGMSFTAYAPGQVVTITDPQTGAAIMVGTQRASGQGVLAERRGPEFLLPITAQGIVVEPLSDGISLRVTQAGFILSGGRAGLALSSPQAMDEAMTAAAGLTRLFEFPRQPTEILAGRVRQQVIAAAISPPLARGPKRRALATSLLGLGFGAEAQTLLRVTMRDDPREAASAETIGLGAIAALLAGHIGEADDLADPRLTGTDEVVLWRAVKAAMEDESSSGAAASLAATAALLFTYPDGIGHRIMPLAMETMILGGEADAASRLLAQRPQDPRLAYARALLKQAQGDQPGALALFDELVATRSALDHARAGARAVELRLAMKQLDAKGAADALDALLYAWRGDRRDLALRLRVAELRRNAGEWRAVFAMLRGAKADFPAQAAEMDRQLKDAFAAVPRDPALASMAPTELIALLEENAELMADGPDGEPMRVLLAQKLMALDLPKRADPVLTKLMRAAPYGSARAGFGATLATLRQREGDADGALLALSESNSADMPEAVRERRALIAARVDAVRGDTSGAVQGLSTTRTQEAEEARASLLEEAQDWPAARDALKVLAARVVPRDGMLDDTQLRLVLRLATAAARADDDTTLASLRERMRTRITSGPNADLFRLLTAEPVRGTGDLARARTEMGFARAITAGVPPQKPGAKTP